jgi:predicted DNA-binding transcriptional regulator YafY
LREHDERRRESPILGRMSVLRPNVQGVDRTDRLYAIVEELRASAPRPRSAAELAGRFEVGVRAIERDLAALQRAGVPIQAGATGYTLDKGRSLPPMNLSPAEAVAVGIALGKSGGSPFAHSARTALQKIAAAMSAADSAETRQLAERINVLVPEEEGGQAAVPAIVEEAVAARQVLRLAYLDRNGTETRRDVEPVAFVSGPRDWYLIGWCRLREGPRLFRIDRIRDASLLPETAPVRDLTQVVPRVPDLVAHALEVD